MLPAPASLAIDPDAYCEEVVNQGEISGVKPEWKDAQCSSLW